ncbi:MAG: ribonuclease protein subunit [Archaeoglobi archaeon]|nr:ribonuclease P protein component 1 [Candidatus Mnemosynella bozhongmuii]MDI3502982.1 ribonuclease protein subunit [Archaeoglobi archaeon]MDK2781013.1 ribonuclease protein subunit [Archaeoglobi archaeon]
MELRPENLIYHELLGLNVKVESSTNPSMEGLSGIVVDETANMLVIEVNGKEKKIPKHGNVFLFDLGDVLVRVNGDLLVSRPEMRIKNRFKKKFRIR